MYLRQTLWHNHQHSWLVDDTLQPPVDHREIIVRAEASLVSLGTERLVISESLLPDAEQRMRVPYMRGRFSDDFTYGYSLVGTVVEGPPNLKGRRIHALHPHQSYARIKASDAFLIPDELNTTSATLISNMETAVNAVWDANPTIGDSVVIQGFGIIGALIARLVASIPGVFLTIVDNNKKRAALAKSSGYSTKHSTEDIVEPVAIAFNTARSEGALQSAINCTRYEGLTVELCWHGSNQTSLQLGGSFHYDRKRIISSQVSQIPASRQLFWDYQRRKELAARLLIPMTTKDLLGKSVEFQSAPDFFADLRRSSPSSPGVLLNYKA